MLVVNSPFPCAHPEGPPHRTTTRTIPEQPTAQRRASARIPPTKGLHRRPRTRPCPWAARGQKKYLPVKFSPNHDFRIFFLVGFFRQRKHFFPHIRQRLQIRGKKRSEGLPAARKGARCGHRPGRLQGSGPLHRCLSTRRSPRHPRPPSKNSPPSEIEGACPDPPAHPFSGHLLQMLWGGGAGCWQRGCQVAGPPPEKVRQSHRQPSYRRGKYLNTFTPTGVLSEPGASACTQPALSGPSGSRGCGRWQGASGAAGPLYWTGRSTHSEGM